MAKGITTVTQIDKAIRQASSSSKPAILPLTGYKGLEIQIKVSKLTSAVTATFRHRYTHPYNGKRPYMSLGQYPTMTLEQARQEHQENMRLLAQRIDLITHREQERQAEAAAMNNGFADVVQNWLDHKTNDGKNMPALSTYNSWKRESNLAIDVWGNTPIGDITAPMVLKLCKDIQSDRIDTGKRVRSFCERIFTYAIGNGLIDTNPATQIAGLLQVAKVQHQHAITNPVPFAQLLRDIEALDDSHERTALQLIALLFTRSGDMCQARWADFDLDAATWTFAPQKGQGRSDMVDSLLVPLPRQAVAILKRQYDKTGMYEHVFHSHSRRTKKHLGSYSINKVMNDMHDGYYQGKHVPHGFRASAITLIQEQLKYAKHFPDMQSGHRIKDNNGEAYNRVKFVDERTTMMQEWADYHDKLRAGETVIHANFKQQVKKLG